MKVGKRLAYLQPSVDPPRRPSTQCLEVRIRGKNTSSSFSIPLNYIENREEYMNRIAVEMNLGDQWIGSLLYRNKHRGQFIIDPERDIFLHYAHSLTWKPWLSSLIERFYMSKDLQLQIPDECQGSDLLLALELFGLLYKPDQLVFDSYRSYARTKLWSEYLTQRAALASWISTAMKHGQDQFATLAEGEECVLLSSKKLCVFPNSSGYIHSFFNFQETSEDMRDDFCLFLPTLLDVDASFSMRQVSIRLRNGSVKHEKRAVFMVHPQNNSSPVQSGQLQIQRTRQVLKSSKPLQKPKGPPVRPISKKVPVDDDPLVTAKDLEAVLVPVMEIQASDSKSVTSALTGPFVRDDDGHYNDMYDEEILATAFRHEWLQGNVLNRGISKEMQQLLVTEEPYEQELKTMPKLTPEDISTPPVSTGVMDQKPLFEPMEWLFGMCRQLECLSEVKNEARVRRKSFDTTSTDSLSSFNGNPKIKGSSPVGNQERNDRKSEIEATDNVAGNLRFSSNREKEIAIHQKAVALVKSKGKRNDCVSAKEGPKSNQNRSTKVGTGKIL